MAKQGVQNPDHNNHFERVRNKDRPDEAFTTDRAVRAGRANAASGRIMVTVPNDHFGPIPAEADPRGLVRAVKALCYTVALPSSSLLTFTVHTSECNNSAHQRYQPLVLAAE